MILARVFVIHRFFRGALLTKCDHPSDFGFHPDRDNHGTEVSCEHHDDTGGCESYTVPPHICVYAIHTASHE